jgi:hypothetical protein
MSGPNLERNTSQNRSKIIYKTYKSLRGNSGSRVGDHRPEERERKTAWRRSVKETLNHWGRLDWKGVRGPSDRRVKHWKSGREDENSRSAACGVQATGVRAAGRWDRAASGLGFVSLILLSEYTELAIGVSQFSLSPCLVSSLSSF